MQPDQTYLSMLVVLYAALLLILSGLAKKQLEWKRPEPQSISRRERDRPTRSVGPLPGWMRVVLVAAICVAGAVAGGAGLAGAVAPVAAAVYVAAAAFVLFVTR